MQPALVQGGRQPSTAAAMAAAAAAACESHAGAGRKAELWQPKQGVGAIVEWKWHGLAAELQ